MERHRSYIYFLYFRAREFNFFLQISNYKYIVFHISQNGVYVLQLNELIATTAVKSREHGV